MYLPITTTNYGFCWRDNTISRLYQPLLCFSTCIISQLPPGGQKKKKDRKEKSLLLFLSFIYQFLFTTFHLDNFNMSEANHLANESHIAPCFPNDKCIYSSFVSPFPQFNNSTVDATNEYSNLITGSYGQMQEYPIQGSSTKLAQGTGAHISGDYTAQNIGSWKEGLVSPLANVWCYLPNISDSVHDMSVTPSDVSRYDKD